MLKTPKCQRIIELTSLLNESFDASPAHKHTLLSDLTVDICVSLTKFGLFENLSAELFPRKIVIIHLHLRN